MPFKSKAQQRWAYTKAGTEALGGPAKVSEWNSASKGKKLPEHAGDSRRVRGAVPTRYPSSGKK